MRLQAASPQFGERLPQQLVGAGPAVEAPRQRLDVGSPITEPLEIEKTREAVRADVFGACSYPQMLLRVGWAPINADPLPATPRRELAEVVEWPPQLWEERG